ncbi:MAG TPA: hypothetical protein VK673_18445 [Chthoniobacterales bacterium]|nr:hypothetical protein [Chthoniobacterales bacterium]
MNPDALNHLCGIERFFRPGYQANINEKWIPALEGVQQKLTAGTRVADIGCGYGASTLIMAKAFPKERKLASGASRRFYPRVDFRGSVVPQKLRST